ncbi:hypothetical protein ES707_10665 [subsurface metagenome]
MAWGNLYPGTITTTSINMRYSFGGCYDVWLFIGSTAIKHCGYGSGSGSYTKTGLTPDTNYTFRLKHKQLAP